MKQKLPDYLRRKIRKHEEPEQTKRARLVRLLHDKEIALENFQDEQKIEDMLIALLEPFVPGFQLAKSGCPPKKSFLGDNQIYEFVEDILMYPVLTEEFPKDYKPTLKEIGERTIESTATVEQALSNAADQFHINFGQAKTSYYNAREFHKNHANEIHASLRIGMPEDEKPDFLKKQPCESWKARKKRTHLYLE